MTADIDAVLSRLRERPECRDAVELIEWLVAEVALRNESADRLAGALTAKWSEVIALTAERDAIVRAEESQVGRLEARAQAAEAERDRLREALGEAHDELSWCECRTVGDDRCSFARALGESPVPDEPTAMQGGHPRWPDGDLILIGHRATHPTYGPATVDGVFDDGDACVHLDTPVSGGPYGPVDGVDFSTRTFDGWVRLAASPVHPTGEERAK